MSDTAEAAVRDYYDALRGGDPLERYFLEDESTAKFGISEALFGYDAVADALREQTGTTEGWTVESERLTVAEHGAYATFADEVTMAWTDTEAETDRRFETRWSGTLARREALEKDSSAAQPDDPAWLFRTMHVSTAAEL
ncbi:nuclear transport factor 2 family protein [Natronococcus wangiae]|uniref:nuclear transport factor 2 family protein n=1 Tax=Natronococcus wangiae TaxID=3068275 RepID=UPI00273E9334|nr:nuclear transport factor 2 family protein [Natronococcus sp. AD5]